MARVKKFLQFKDVKLSNLPLQFKEKVKKCHKIVSDIVEAQFFDKKELAKDPDLIKFKQDFCKHIADEKKKVRLYKVNNNDRDCMIQLMNHVPVNEDKKVSNKIHNFIKRVFGEANKKIKTLFGFSLDNENESNKKNFEGFDIYPTKSDSVKLWDNVGGTVKNFEDLKNSKEEHDDHTESEEKDSNNSISEPSNENKSSENKELQPKTESSDDLKQYEYSNDADRSETNGLHYKYPKLSPEQIKELEARQKSGGLNYKYDGSDYDLLKSFIQSGVSDEELKKSGFSQELIDKYRKELKEECCKKTISEGVEIGSVSAPATNGALQGKCQKKLAIMGSKLLQDNKIDQSFVNILKNELDEAYISKFKEVNSNEFKIILDQNKDITRLEIVSGVPDEEFLTKFFNGRADLFKFIMDSNCCIKATPSFFLSIKSKDDLFNFFRFLFMEYIPKILPKICAHIARNFVNLNSVSKDLLSKTDLKSIFSLLMHQALVFPKITLPDIKQLRDSANLIKTTTAWIIDLMKKMTADNKKNVMDEISDAIKEYRESISPSDLYFDIIKLDKIVENYIDGKYDYIKKRVNDYMIHECADYSDPKDFDTKEYIRKYNILRLKKFDLDQLEQIEIRLENTSNKLRVTSDLIPIMEKAQFYKNIINNNLPGYIVPYSLNEITQIESKINDLYKRSINISSDRNPKPLGF